MSTVRVVAIEPCNQHKPGDRFDTTEHEARELMRAGLVKMLVPAQNKMMPEPVNKQNPLQAAGAAQMLSASPVAPVSRKTTAAPSKTGKRRGRPPGRSSR